MKKILFSLLMLCCMTAAWAEGTGDGTKEHPYTGEWEASVLCPELKEGDYLGFDCVINGYITIQDIRLNQEVVHQWPAWSPGNLIENPQAGSKYVQYGKDNPPANRKGQSFIVKNVSRSTEGYKGYIITGYFSGFYTTTDADGFVYVESAEQMRIILQGNSNVNANTSAKIRLTDDIYLTDIAVGTFCDTFYGTLDGDGHTIHGSHDGTRQNKTFLFANSNGATFKNLNFYNIRVDSRENDNQAVITSKAMGNCVFENITFDHVSIYTSEDNAGSAAGWTQDCTFSNITVRNSDLTANETQSGAVVGHAMNCSFENIKVEHCESTARDDQFFQAQAKAGGAVGRADNCNFNGVEILGCFIKTPCRCAGGIVGYSDSSHYTNCTIDDQSCVYAFRLSDTLSDVGGITGVSYGDEIYNCINSALIASGGLYAGGIAGYARRGTQIENCLNTGMVISIGSLDVNGYYSMYKNKQLPCVAKCYNGKEYVVRKTELGKTSYEYYGGIVGRLEKSTVSKCANIGSMNETSSTGGIVGEIETGTISDCLSDVESPHAIYGILGAKYGRITNCVNASGKTSYPGSVAVVTNLYAYDLNNMTENELASGEICALLGAAWEQNVGVDPYPTPTVTVFSDDTEYNYNYYSTTGSVAIKRTFDTDGWYSLCLPFDATQTAEKFAQVAEFREIEGDTYKFTTVDHIEAGKPYIVRVGTKLENPKFTNVTIAANVEANESGAFVGVLKPTEVNEGDLAIGSGNTVNPMRAGTMKAFRAYFPQTSANAAKAMRFTVDDGEATSIELMQNAEPKEGGQRESQCRMQNYYNLAGQKVDENYRGIVIKNGKKVLKK